ncbi:2-C-methyl-D-erythritol 4-phosphate cytidylyltransferase [Oceanirhabdus sp. W0125-5]|uniref:2-C-methyl-D-erythritol 4-phosphate cytidylyltransferase n=1 Tax=Oceanirhabdus sp. W0125-5 TaxID=2999116 RepID=UPI0022F307B6|nr:2-C-methyl-D-erythritol 4-phosphate cytidylyltransferase [Oceanirhabdus sp. W0125-5]WBW97972.1 2-C-methyl-D-erythritol 4-phosphate cytidylyltransferase [Oceanirhabdus sp. W0125-5]
MKVGAIVLAAGKGSRMKAGINKQFLEIQEKPILYYSLNVFERNSNIDFIVVVCSPEEKLIIKDCIIDKYGFKKVKMLVAGGKERKDSVFNGLKVMEGVDVVLIHDGARPFINNRIIDEGIEHTLKFNCCACGVMPVDTIKVVDGERLSKYTPKRSDLIAVQTPQCFKYDLIRECHEKVNSQGIEVTDDTSVVEYFGNKVYLYEGSYNNIKITTPKDMIMAKEIYKNLFTK